MSTNVHQRIWKNTSRKLKAIRERINYQRRADGLEELSMPATLDVVINFYEEQELIANKAKMEREE